MSRNFSIPRFFKRFRSKGKVVTRIAPSPTGAFHIGTARSALFNFLFARHHEGAFIVRIEDTDKERNRKEYEKDILDGLLWLHLGHDAFFRQSERALVYATYIQQLLKSGHAYLSKEQSKKGEGVETEVVRLKNPGTDISFNDIVRGNITFNTAELGDFVIARGMSEPLYHLAVVVDDHEMRVTHVIRGEDHISNTPRQILIGRALGVKEPKYGHIPLILASDRSKLSKRKGSTSISEYREEGYLPEAMLNYLAFLGWNPGTDRELYTLEELIHDFSLEHVQKGGAVFDVNKLNWFNREHLRLQDRKVTLLQFESTLLEKIKKLPQYSKERLERMVDMLIERISTLKELEALEEEGELDYFFAPPKMEASVAWKQDGKETARTRISEVIHLLEAVPEDAFTKEAVKGAVWKYAEEKGRGSVLWPMRVALSGKEKSPDPFVLAGIFGKKETLKRLNEAKKRLE